MALKNSRSITVRGVHFKWKLKKHPDMYTRFGQSPKDSHVAVQLANTKGAGKLIAWITSTQVLPAESDVSCGAVHRAHCGPGDVRMLIEHCLDNGWDPMSRGQFECPAGVLMREHRTYTRAKPSGDTQ